MNHRVKDAIMASFVADAFALGVHWIYNVRVIDRKYGRVDELLAPKLASFHTGKEKGNFTHYGDQMFLLLESLNTRGGFDPSDFMDRWQTLMKSGSCYLDSASKDTMANLDGGASLKEAGSDSTDLAGAARIAPLLLLPCDTAGELARIATELTSLTHANQAVMDAAAFFACAARLSLDGCRPVDALTLAVDEAGGAAELREAVAMGLESRDKESRVTIAEFGQMCEIEASLPSTIHLIAKHEANLKEALIENVMAGGDSAARGMLTGLILGAHHGIESIPSHWLKGMIRFDEISAILERF